MDEQTPSPAPPPQVVVVQQKSGMPGWAVLLIVLAVVFLLVVPCGFLGLGIMLPALGKARESAQELRARTQLRGIAQALTIYAQQNDDALPPPDAWRDLLVREGYLPDELLVSPLGDGVDDYIYVAHPTFTFEPDRVLVYEDPAHYDGDVLVGFHDGVVELIPRTEFEEILAASGAASAEDAADEGP